MRQEHCWLMKKVNNVTRKLTEIYFNLASCFNGLYWYIPFSVVRHNGIDHHKYDGNWHRDRQFKTYYIFGIRIAVIEC